MKRRGGVWYSLLCFLNEGKKKGKTRERTCRERGGERERERGMK